MRRLLMIRHGESEWNAAGRWQGQADPPLSERGRRQARAAADCLGAIDAVASSTLQRAADTAAIISEVLGVGPVVLEPGLQERDAGEWQGLTRAEIEQHWPSYLAERRRPPRYESDSSLRARVDQALQRLDRHVGAQDLVIVTHGGVINALEASFGLGWERLPNLAGRWFRWERGGLQIGERMQLVLDENLTIEERDRS